MEAYAEEVRKASLERLAHLIKICGFLMQTKVYLLWAINFTSDDGCFSA